MASVLKLETRPVDEVFSRFQTESSESALVLETNLGRDDLAQALDSFYSVYSDAKLNAKVAQYFEQVITEWKEAQV